MTETNLEDRIQMFYQAIHLQFTTAKYEIFPNMVLTDTLSEAHNIMENKAI